MTIEDPIEFLHRHKKCIVNQRELGGDAKSFAMALKAALRQDPDVILVGEMRDMETIGTALTAAETGHLVFATLHTQDAPQTVDRIIDVFPPAQQGQIRAQLAIGLQGVVTQTLIPTADGNGRCVAAEVLVPTPGRAQPDPRGQDAPDLLADPDRRRARHADDGHLARGPRPRRQDHDGDRRGALLEPGGAAQARRGRARSAPTWEWRPDGDLRVQGGRPRRPPADRQPRRRQPPGGDRGAQGPRPAGHGARREEVRPPDGASRSGPSGSRRTS